MDEEALAELTRRLEARATDPSLSEVVPPLVRALTATARALSFADDDDDVRAQLEEDLRALWARAASLLEAGADDEVTTVRADPSAEVTLVRRPNRPTPRIVPPRRRR